MVLFRRSNDLGSLFVISNINCDKNTPFHHALLLPLPFPSPKVHFQVSILVFNSNSCSELLLTVSFSVVGSAFATF